MHSAEKLSEKINQTLVPNSTGFLLALVLTRGFFLMGILLEGQLSSSAVSLPERSSAAGQEPTESRDCFPAPPQHKHVGLRSSCCRAFCTFQSRDFYLPLSVPGARERAENRKEAAPLGQRGRRRLLLFGISAGMHPRPALAAKLQMNP